MLGNRQFYHETVRNIIVGFGTLFNDIHVVRKNNSGVITQSMKVPLAYGPKQKWLARLDQDAGLDSKVAITLPRLGFEIQNLTYDPARKLNRVQKFKKVKSSANNSNKLDTALSNAIAMLSTTDFLMEFLKPLHTYINDECSRGSLRYIQEKFAKVSIRNCLSNLYTTFRSSKDDGPRMIIGSLTSEHENLDTLIHIIVAQNIGWDVTYVGNSIPHDEMTYMANKIEARTIVVALNNPRDIARKTYEIKTMKELADMKDNIVLIGTQASNYRQIADDVKAIISQDLSSFRLTLERLYGLIR